MDFDLRNKTILLVVSGSRAYGMSTSESDVDLKGVCIPPRKYRDGFIHKFEQADKKHQMVVYYDCLLGEEKEKAEQDEVEGSVYEVRKFLSLASKNNPNILDALFCRDCDVRICSKEGRLIREYANKFLSKKCRWTFGGYAKDQLKRIKIHRGYLLNPPTHKPTRNEFDLPERAPIPKEQLMAAQDAIRKKIDSWEIDYGLLDESEKIYIHDQMVTHWAEIQIGADERFAAAARTIGYTENFIELLDRERRYRKAIDEYRSYIKWKNERNPERAAMEAKFGFDGKHASHLVRLYRMCLEILMFSKVEIYRHDAEELLDIRNGAWTYDELLEFVDTQEDKIKDAYRISELPDAPDIEEINNLCCDLLAGE